MLVLCKSGPNTPKGFKLKAKTGRRAIVQTDNWKAISTLQSSVVLWLPSVGLVEVKNIISTMKLLCYERVC